jgi:hypothetical protein
MGRGVGTPFAQRGNSPYAPLKGHPGAGGRPAIPGGPRLPNNPYAEEAWRRQYLAAAMQSPYRPIGRITKV